MPTYRIKAPDGTSWDVTAPEGATQDQVLAFAQQNWKPTAQQQFSTEMAKAESDPTTSMTGFERGAAGAGKAVYDMGRGVKQLVAPALAAVTGGLPGALEAQRSAQGDVDEAKARDAALMATTEGKVGNAAGNVAALTTALLVPGVNTIAGSTLLGLGTGAIQPTATGESRLQNIGEGGAAGAGGAALAKTIGAARSLLQPFTKGGRSDIAARAVLKAVAPDAAVIEQRLANAAELVPGSRPTAAEVAQSGGMSALQRAAQSANPQAYDTRALEQASARAEALRGIAGDDAKRQAAVTARAQASSPLYTAAEQAAVAPDATFITLAKRPAMQKAMQDADKLLAERGVDPANAPPVVYLQAVKFSLDSMVNTAPQQSIAGAQLDAIKGTRGELLKWLESKVPEFTKANAVYAQLSKPITQMDIGQHLYDTMRPALTDATTVPRETAAQFAKAIRDSGETARRVTGQETATLENTLTPDQIKTLKSILADLGRKTEMQSKGMSVGSNTAQNFAMTHLMDQAGVPTWLRRMAPAQIIGGLTGRGAKALYGGVDEDIRQELARLLLEPRQLAAVMRGLKVSPNQQALANVLRLSSATLPIGTANAQQ